MKALVYTDIETVVYKDYEDPIIKPGESLIKVNASGICGSDMHAYHGKDERRVPPLILGHEISGIVEVGKNIGQKVIINPLDIKKAAISEPTAVSLHAVELGEKNLRVSIKDANILIIGGGAIGILSALILENIKQSNNVTLIEINQKRLKVCEGNLKSKVISPNSKDLKINSFDLIIDAVGNEKTRQIATQFAKPGSVIIHAGLTNSDGTFDSRKITLQEISFIGTYCYTTRDFQNTINFLSDGLIGDLNWIEYRELKNGPEAFKQIHNGTCAAPKIILIP